VVAFAVRLPFPFFSIPLSYYSLPLSLKYSLCVVTDYQGIDMTGVVTEVDLFFPNVKTACDCIAACLTASASCTNWVWKHTGNPLDGGRRSCTLYSSPNLPSGVTLDYNLALSSGFQLLQDANNPQVGGGAPITVLANGQPDPFGVSGFLTQDANGLLYC
jgi:hypothetical protein